MNVILSGLVVGCVLVMVGTVAASLREEQRIRRRLLLRVLRDCRDLEQRLAAESRRPAASSPAERRCVRRFLLQRRGLGAQEGRQP